MSIIIHTFMMMLWDVSVMGNVQLFQWHCMEKGQYDSNDEGFTLGTDGK